MLKDPEQLLNVGQAITDVCEFLEVSTAPYQRLQQLYRGMKATEGTRLKELKQMNSRLKRLLSEAELDKPMIIELADGNIGDRNPVPRPSGILGVRLWASERRAWHPVRQNRTTQRNPEPVVVEHLLR